MRKLILTLSILLAILISCKKKEEIQTIDSLIESKNLKAIEVKKNELQQEIIKLDEAIASLSNKKEEALVSVIQLKDTIFNHYLNIQGNIDTKENILIQPEIPGTLVKLNVKTGQRVTKGQLLGVIDDSGIADQVASLETQYELAKTTYEKQKNLWSQKIGSEIQYLQAKTQMLSLSKSVAQAKAQLSKTQIRAPFSGTIDEIFVERGQVVSVNPQGLMRIVNLNNMYVSTTVPENYIGKLKIGTPVEVSLISLGKIYKGKVRQIGNFINPNNRSFGIEVSVPNPENLLRPNQVAQLKIADYTVKNCIAISSNIIQEDAQKNKFVFIVENKKGQTGIAKKAIVKIGQSSNNLTEILEGLQTGDVLIVEGANTISEGMKINF